MNQNLEQLKKLAQIFNTDKLISPEEIQQIFKGIVEILATYKKDTSSINEDTKSVVNKLLEDVISIHKESVDAVEEKKKELGNDFADKLTELRQMVTSIQEEMNKEDEMPEDDTDDEEEKQALIAEIMAQITLPEVKATIVSGEEIVDKINELDLSDDNKIDYARLKNVPQIKGKVISGSPTVLANAVDLDGSTRQDTYAIVWDAARGRYTHAASGGGGGGSPGGSTTQLQYNNAGAFGGISGATTDGTAVTYTANNLKAADITASGSGGFLIQSNSGTDVGLFGAGGGAGATFYGGVNIGGSLTVDTNTLYVDATNNVVGIGTASPLTQTGNVLQVGSTAAVNQYLVFQTNNGAERGIQYYLLDGTTLRGYMKWDGEEDLLLKGDTLKISTQNVTNPFHFGDGGGIGLFGIGTTAPTHSLTLNSTSTGIALYNTADQTTNYERGEMVWSANEWLIRAFKGGTGTQRNIKLISHGILTISGSASSSGDFIFNGSTSSAGAVNIATNSTFSATSGVNTELKLAPTISQSSTAGYTALLVNPTETTTGSGTKLLADFQVGGSSKVAITNTGNIGIGTITPTAGVHLKAGTATASTAPLKFTAGTVNTTPEAGTIEFTNAEDGLTFTAVSTRRKVVLDTATQTLTNKTLTTPVINGATLNGDLQIDATPNTDDTWNGKSTNTFNAGATIAQFDCVYLSSSSTWLLTDADAIGTAGNVLVMMAGEAGTDTNPLRVIEPGSWVRNDAWNWTIGGVLYLDTATPGGMTQTAPSGEDDAVKIVGHAVTADVIYFAPSPNWIIYAA